MLTNLKNHYYPETIEEIIKLASRPGAKILAGATSLIFAQNEKIETLVDLQFANLSYIREEGDYFAIGSMTNAYDIYSEKKLNPTLRFAADCVGDTPIMHAITIGGNLAKFYYWNDLPPVLWALNASFVIYKPEKMIMDADEFFRYSLEQNIATRKEFITEIRIPKLDNDEFCEYQSFVTTKNEKSQLSIASYVKIQDGKVTSPRLIVSGVKKSFMRLSETEKEINGKEINQIDMDKVISQAKNEVKLISSYKLSESYRKTILGVYLKRTLENMKEVRS